MSAGYYIDRPSAEKEAVDRWENEGGRLGRNHDYIFDLVLVPPIVFLDRVMEIRRLGKRDDISHVKFLASDRMRFEL